MDRLTCGYHPDALLVEDHQAGDMICSECGLVVGERMVDVTSEWRTFSNETRGENPSRVGGPENTFLNGSDLSTIVGPSSGSASFDEFGNSKYTNRNTMSSSDRILTRAYEEIANMAARIHLPKSIVDRANSLFKQLHDGQNLKIRNNNVIASTCLYIACRQDGVPRTFREICAISGISKKKISRCYTLILKALETRVDSIETGNFMSRFCSNLGLSRAVQKAATHIARKAVETDIVAGKSPITVAAAAIYMASKASNKKITLNKISRVLGVAVNTTGTAYKLMQPYAPSLFPSDFKPAIPYDQLTLNTFCFWRSSNMKNA